MRNNAVHVLLRFDAGRPFLERHAVDGGAAGHAQRLDRLVDAARDRLARIRIDNQDAHRTIRSYNRRIHFRGRFPMLHRRAVLTMAAALVFAGSALAQTKQPPLRTGVDGTFAPHAMPKLGGGTEGFQIDLFTEVAKRMGREITFACVRLVWLIPGMLSERYK